METRLTDIRALSDFKRAVIDDFDKGYNYCIDELQIIAPEYSTYIESKEIEREDGSTYTDHFCHNCQGYWDLESNKGFTHCPYCGAVVLEEAAYLYINQVEQN